MCKNRSDVALGGYLIPPVCRECHNCGSLIPPIRIDATIGVAYYPFMAPMPQWEVRTPRLSKLCEITLPYCQIRQGYLISSNFLAKYLVVSDFFCIFVG